MNYPQLSVQLYTVREAMLEDLPGTLQRIADLGFTQVEPYNFAGFEGLGAGLAAAGLAAPTAHGHFIGESDAELERVFGIAKDLGIATAIDPFTAPERWETAESIGQIADQLNAAAAIAAKYGVVVGYHNHAHELKSVIDGVTGIEIFAGKLAPEVVLEIDTYWVAVGGQDPVELLKRLGNKVVAIHVKDGPATTETKDQVAVGSGSLPIADIVAAAPTALRVIELDDSRGDRFQAVADSYAYLVKENLA
ncbi:MAG: sugar phosphate isomerase/epimerase [Glaciihabitans sp.]|nr:sugar phosphate isomerase/epimerase [Glaciihabitans sp.]